MNSRGNETPPTQTERERWGRIRQRLISFGWVTEVHDGRECLGSPNEALTVVSYMSIDEAARFVASVGQRIGTMREHMAAGIDPIFAQPLADFETALQVVGEEYGRAADPSPR